VAPHLIGRFLRHRTSRMAELVYAPLDAQGLQGLLAEQMRAPGKAAAGGEGGRR
jgi:hypothetical protein